MLSIQDLSMLNNTEFDPITLLTKIDKSKPWYRMNMYILWQIILSNIKVIHQMVILHADSEELPSQFLWMNGSEWDKKKIYSLKH